MLHDCYLHKEIGNLMVLGHTQGRGFLRRKGYFRGAWLHVVWDFSKIIGVPKWQSVLQKVLLLWNQQPWTRERGGRATRVHTMCRVRDTAMWALRACLPQQTRLYGVHRGHRVRRPGFQGVFVLDVLTSPPSALSVFFFFFLIVCLFVFHIPNGNNPGSCYIVLARRINKWEINWETRHDTIGSLDSAEYRAYIKQDSIPQCPHWTQNITHLLLFQRAWSLSLSEDMGIMIHAPIDSPMDQFY